MNAIYRVDGNRVVTSPNAAGPWEPAHAARLGAVGAGDVGGGSDSDAGADEIARVTIDLMRPVPVAPLTIETEILREGRKIQLCDVKLLADGVSGRRRHRAQDQAQALSLPRRRQGVAGHAAVARGLAGRGRTWRDQSVRGMVSMRAARGRFGQAGAGAIWFRLDHPLVEGEAVSQAMRAVVAADFSNGTASTLDFRAWTYINADLTVNFSRQPVGEWILLDGGSWIGPDGAGLAMSRLADRRGYFGRAVQSLVIEKR